MRLITTALFIILFIGLTSPVWGQEIILNAWNTNNLSGITDDGWEATTNATNVKKGELSRGGGVTATTLSNGFAASGWNVEDLATAKSENKYFEFFVEAEEGFELNISSVQFWVRRTNTGPTRAQLSYSIDEINYMYVGPEFEYPVTGSTEIIENPPINLSAITDLQNLDKVHFRIYAWGASASGGTFAIGISGSGTNDLTIEGTVESSDDEEPFISVTPSSLSDFQYIEGFGPSASQSFTVNASNLDPQSGNLTVTGSASYEVSDDNESFSDFINIPYSDGTVTDYEIFVRLKEGLDAGVHEEVITVSGGDADPATVNVSGQVTEPFPEDPLVAYPIEEAGDLEARVAEGVSSTDLAISTGTISFGDAQPETWEGPLPYAQGSGGWSANNPEDAKNFFFTISSDMGFVFQLDQIEFEERATGAGPSAFTIFVNEINVETQNVPDGDTRQHSIDLNGFENLSEVTIRFAGWDNESRSTTGGGQWRVNDFKIFGEVSEAPEDPLILVSLPSLENFEYEEGDGPSAPQSFTVNASNLAPPSDNLTVTGSDNYEVSDAEGGPYSGSFNIPYEDGTVTDFDVFVRLMTDRSAGTYDNEEITVSGGGADPATINVSGQVTEPPGLRTWTGGGDVVSWDDAANWDPAVVPGEGDDVLLDNSIVLTSYIVSLPDEPATTTITSLTISPTVGQNITLVLPINNTANPGLRLTGSGDALVLDDGGIFINSSAPATGAGVDLSASGATIRINNGGRYIQNTPRVHATALVAKLSTAAGTEEGIFEFDVPGSGIFTPSISGRNYGTLIFSDSNEDGRTYRNTSTGTLTIRGNLIVNTDVTFSGTETAAFPLLLSGVSPQAIIGIGSLTLIRENFQHTNVTLNNADGLSLNLDITIGGILTLTDGNINTGSNTLTLGPDATLIGETTGRYIIGAIETTRDVDTGSNNFGGIGVELGAGTDPIGEVTVTRVSGQDGIVTFESNEGIARRWKFDGNLNHVRDLTLSWVTDDDNTKDMTTAQVWRGDVTTTDPWNPIGAPQDISALDIREITVSIDSFSDYTVSDEANPLTPQDLVLTVDPTSLDGFQYVVGMGPSASQSFTVDASNLNPDEDDLTVTGSTSYQVSLDNSSFSDDVTIPYTGGIVSDVTVHVRLITGLDVGTYDETVTVSGGGAPDATVSVSGEVLDDFVIETATIEGTVTVNGTVLENVTINLLNSDLDLILSMETDAAGFYQFIELAPEDYVVQIIPPLGYSVIGDEFVNVIGLESGETETVDFTLEVVEIVTEVRGMGYWKHQFDVHVFGRGRAHESAENLNTYISRIHSNYTPHFNFYADLSTFPDWQGVLTVNRGGTHKDRAIQHLAALVLNFASLKIHQSDIVTVDNRTAGDVLTHVSELINGGATKSEFELAKDLAEMVNEQVTIPGGIVPAGGILYKGNAKKYINWEFGKPYTFVLHNNFPNPFNPTTNIVFELPEISMVSLHFYNILGQKVGTLIDNELYAAGVHTIKFDGSNLPSGVYLYRLSTDGFEGIRTMILTK